MYYVYILQSLKDSQTYVGYTNDLNRRVFEHNSGRCKSTRYRRPFKLMYFEKFKTINEAKKQELWWESSVGRRKLKDIFSNL